MNETTFNPTKVNLTCGEYRCRNRAKVTKLTWNDIPDAFCGVHGKRERYWGSDSPRQPQPFTAETVEIITARRADQAKVAAKVAAKKQQERAELHARFVERQWQEYRSIEWTSTLVIEDSSWRPEEPRWDVSVRVHVDGTEYARGWEGATVELRIETDGSPAFIRSSVSSNLTPALAREYAAAIAWAAEMIEEVNA
jgi:hypothetical protein